MESFLEDEDAMDEGIFDKLKKRKLDDANKKKALPLDQTEGEKDEKQAKTRNHLRRPSQLNLPKALPNLNQNLLESLHKQRRQCLRLEILKSHRIKDKIQNNPKGKEYLFNLSKPLPLIMDRGHQVVPIDYFFNNDLEYLRGGSSSKKYTTFTTKTKAAKYDIPSIEYMVPSVWSPVKVSKHEVYSTKRIIAVTKVKVMKWYDYGYLEEIEVRREDQQLYKFKEGDFPRLHLHDIEEICIDILKRVEDLQMGVESYQKKLNITKPETFSSDISKRIPYTTYNNPQGIIYEDKYKRNMLMRTDELYKFSDGMLTFVRPVLHDIALNLRMDYLPKKRWSSLDRKRSHIMIKAIDY
ncbi:hypothetical protein Tco_0320814 [Tanacetum coccineum]